MDNIELKNCPFCSGKAKVSFSDYRFIGYRGRGDKVVLYRVQVICNRCKSRGKPIITNKLVNPNPYNIDKCSTQAEMFAPYIERAINAWNTRKGGEQ